MSSTCPTCGTNLGWMPTLLDIKGPHLQRLMPCPDCERLTRERDDARKSNDRWAEEAVRLRAALERIDSYSRVDDTPAAKWIRDTAREALAGSPAEPYEPPSGTCPAPIGGKTTVAQCRAAGQCGCSQVETEGTQSRPVKTPHDHYPHGDGRIREDDIEAFFGKERKPVRSLASVLTPATCDYPIVGCPSCSAQQEDMDGFGVLHCDVCGYCAHPQSTNGKCTICGAAT